MPIFIQNALESFGASNITSLMTISVTIMGAVALLLSNLARYLQASKYGIPIKAASQATMGDSAAIWVLLIRMLGFGVLLPLFMLTVEWPWWSVYPVIAVSFFFAISAHLLMRFLGPKKKEYKGKTYEIWVNYAYYHLAIVSAVLAVPYLRVRAVYQYVYIDGGELFSNGVGWNILFFVSAFFTGLYLLYLAYKFFWGIKVKLTGGYDSMVAEIDGQMYLVAMRSSHYYWILVPCELETVVVKQYKNGNTRTRDNILFVRERFIIKDLTTLDAPIKRMSKYGVVDMGIPVEDAS